MKKRLLIILSALILSSLSACANYDFGETGQYIVTADEVESLVADGAIVVDARSAEDYLVDHLAGAINIPMGALVVNEPYANMLPEADQIEMVMGAAGVSENDTLLIYDNSNNMLAARVQWTLNMYSNFNVKVISGGYQALINEGLEMNTTNTTLPETVYTAGEYQKTLITSLAYINSTLNIPDENIVIIDTRSAEEYNAGTIPGVLHKEYVWTMYANGVYKTVDDLQSTYLDEGLMPDTRIILFCKTSVRAAQVYTALKDAGYTDVRIYDGAWLEYSELGEVWVPSSNITPTKQDAS